MFRIGGQKAFRCLAKLALREMGFAEPVARVACKRISREALEEIGKADLRRLVVAAQNISVRKIVCILGAVARRRGDAGENSNATREPPL